MKIVILGFVVLLLLFIAIGMVYQNITTKLNHKRFKPLGKLIDIGGYNLHINCIGDKRPTVILESGFGVNCLGWSLVQSEIAKFARVCSYDRAGYGWSDKSPLPRKGDNFLNELHNFLSKAKIEPPYILVGHSMGGSIVQAYAKKYPDEVIGIVLVDSAHEKQDEKLPSEPKKTWKQKLFSSPTIGLLMTRLGILRYRVNTSKNKEAIRKKYKMFSQEILDMMLAHQTSVKQIKAMMQEAAYMKENFSQLKNLDINFGDLPFTVIASAKLIDKETKSDLENQYLAKLNKAFMYLQEDLVTRSSNSKFLIAEKSSHMIPFYQPEIIIKAVRELVEVNYNR